MGDCSVQVSHESNSWCLGRETPSKPGLLVFARLRLECCKECTNFITVISNCFINLRGVDTLKGEVTLSKWLCLPSEKEVNSKRKQFAPVEAIFFLLELTDFRWG